PRCVVCCSTVQHTVPHGRLLAPESSIWKTPRTWIGSVPVEPIPCANASVRRDSTRGVARHHSASGMNTRDHASGMVVACMVDITFGPLLHCGARVTSLDEPMHP